MRPEVEIADMAPPRPIHRESSDLPVSTPRDKQRERELDQAELDTWWAEVSKTERGQNI